MTTTNKVLIVIGLGIAAYYFLNKKNAISSETKSGFTGSDPIRNILQEIKGQEQNMKFYKDEYNYWSRKRRNVFNNAIADRHVSNAIAGIQITTKNINALKQRLDQLQNRYWRKTNAGSGSVSAGISSNGLGGGNPAESVIYGCKDGTTSKTAQGCADHGGADWVKTY